MINSEDIIIRNNTLSAFTGSGIRVFASENCTVQWNTVTSGAYGIEIEESSDLAVVQNNTVLHNSFGFMIQNSNNLAIRYNEIGENSEGVRLSNVGFSLIYANTFYNNTAAQAIDSGGINNTWYYNQTGNFWADYQNHYPNATNDGRVWNIPYNISWAGFIDFYPLVYSAIWVEGLNPPLSNTSNPPPQNQTRTDDLPVTPPDPENPAPPSDISIPGFDIWILAAVSIAAILIVAKQIVKNKGRKSWAFKG